MSKEEKEIKIPDVEVSGVDSEIKEESDGFVRGVIFPEEEEEDEASKSKIKKKSGKKKKKTSPGKIILIILLIMLIILALAGITVVLIFHNYYDKLNYDDGNIDIASMTTEYDPANDPDIDPNATETDAAIVLSVEEQLAQNLADKSTPIKYSDDVYNILLIGHDSRDPNLLGNSDSMIIVSINRKTEQIVLTSVMRDIYIERAGYGYGRINAAFPMGGPDLLIQTIEENFKIKIDGYATVNFFSFVDVVDAVGGVEIEVRDEEVGSLNHFTDRYYQLSGETNVSTPLTIGGTYLLDGPQALSYARIRYIGNADYERTERQRKVLTAIFTELKGGSLVELNDVLNKVLPNVTTNISEGEMFSLILNTTTEYRGYSIHQYRVPYDGTFTPMNVGGAAVLGIDIEQNIANMHRDIYGDE